MTGPDPALNSVINGAGITPAQADPALIPIIMGSDPVAASGAALQAAQAAQTPMLPAVLTIYDRFYNVQGDIGNYIEVQPTFSRLELPQAQMIIDAGHPLATAICACDTTVVPFAYQIGPLRWGGRIDVAHDKMAEDGTQTIECQIVGDLTMLDRITVWPEPFLPIEAQPSAAIFIGPAITCLKTMVAENVLRIQLGINEFINTAGSLDPDWEAWFGTLLTQNSLSITDLMQMVTTPICVTFTDPLFDTSPWVAFHGRMDTCWKLMEQQLRDNGLYASLDLWLPGEPQPQGVLFPLTVPTLVFNIRDYQGVTGPTQTGFDGLIEEAVDIEGGLLGNTLAPFLNPANEYVPPGSNIEIAPVFGVNFVPAWVVFNADLDASGLVTYDFAHHHPLCWQIILGGRSPQWLNDILNATLEWLVDMLMMSLGITGISNTILDGILDNTFLAFELFELFNTRVTLGPYGFPEKFFPTQSTYDIDTLFSAINAAWDVRGWPSCQFAFIDGTSYRIGVDLFPAAMASIIRRGVLYSDYLDKITIIDNRTTRKVIGQVGDGRREEGPMAIFQRKLVGVEEDVNLLMLAPPNG